MEKTCGEMPLVKKNISASRHNKKEGQHELHKGKVTNKIEEKDPGTKEDIMVNDYQAWGGRRRMDDGLVSYLKDCLDGGNRNFGIQNPANSPLWMGKLNLRENFSPPNSATVLRGGY